MYNKKTTLEPITDPAKLRARALYWLGKKDYSVKDFQTKLDKVCELDELKSDLLDDLIKRDWLSDERYMQGFVRQKLASGLGLMRIRQELQMHGIKSDELSNYVEELEIDWFEQALNTYQKKYGYDQVTDFKEKSKRFRYMQYRGFGPDEIKFAMEHQSEDW
jgi:regulatory protein